MSTITEAAVRDGAAAPVPTSAATATTAIWIKPMAERLGHPIAHTSTKPSTSAVRT